ncbi:MAG: hypothetical protein P1V97_09080 [Planctomycetota bacterium]|nr:hypothetical protein [Planctomycetota bacterium]
MMKKLALICLFSTFFVGPVWAQDDEENTEEVIQRLLEKIIEEAEESGKDAVDRTDAASGKDRKAAKEIRRTLKTRRVTVNFDDTPFADAMDFIRDVTSLNIVVSKKAKEVVDDSGKKVNLRLKKVRLRSVLIHILEGIDKDLCFGVSNTVLMIGTKEEFKGKSISLRSYDLSDIIRKPKDFPAPRLGLPDNTKNKP